MNLLDYQKDIYNGALNSIRTGHKYPLVVLPTGGGKTFVFCTKAKSSFKKNKLVYIISPRRNITGSISKTLKILDVPHGIVAPGFTQLKHNIQICSVYSTKRLLSLPQPDMMIFDEGHHGTSSLWRKLIEAWPETTVIGYTATPVRSDGQGLGIQAGGIYDDMIEGLNVADLIERGKTLGFGLSDYEYFGAREDIDLSNVNIKNNDFDENSVRDLMTSKKIIGSAVDYYLDVSKNLPGLAFCVSVDAADKTAEEFRARGVRARSLTGNVSPAQQEKMINQLADGTIDVITSCQIVSEGTDIPVCNTMIDLAPTWSLGLSQQRRGRVLRYMPNKTAIIIDPVNNWTRTDLPDTPHKWDLNQAKVKRRKGETASLESITKTRQCDNCEKVHPVQPTCPRCGFVYPSNRELEVVEGGLVKLSKDDINKIKKQKRMEQGRARTYEELVEVGKAQGKDPRWAGMVWRNRKKKGRLF